MISAVWGGLDFPVTQPYGPTTLSVEPLYGLVHWHCGIDIGCPSGTKLYAARSGRVTWLSYGILGIEVTGTTQTDFYVHIDRSVVAYRSSVARGALVAYSGSKVPSGGYLTGPHLHFEVNSGGLNVPPASDPVPILAGLYGSGGSTIDDMTPAQEAKLDSVLADIKAIYFALGLPAANLADPTAAKSPVLTAIQNDLVALNPATQPALKLGGSFSGTLTAE